MLAVDGEVYTDGRDPLAPWDPSGIDLEEELVKLRQRSSEPVYVPDEEKPPRDEGLPGGTSSPSDSGGQGSSTDKPGSDSDRKWRGRSVFQGNRVSDERNDHAIFSELGSSPASMEAPPPLKSLMFSVVSPGTQSSRLTRSRLTHKHCSKALKRGSDSHATGGLRSGKDSKTQ